jgi:hypothetical protein
MPTHRTIGISDLTCGLAAAVAVAIRASKWMNHEIGNTKLRLNRFQDLLVEQFGFNAAGATGLRRAYTQRIK